jgi:hypothetical protein
MGNGKMKTQARQMTEEKRSKIAELWNLGWTSSHIADAVGLSRNSVIGAVHRLRKGGAMMTTREERKKPKAVKKTNERAIIKRTKKNENLGKPANILNLTFQSCRYIVEEGDVYNTKYCNKQIDRGAYCKEHYKICYVPAKKSWS